MKGLLALYIVAFYCLTSAFCQNNTTISTTSPNTEEADNTSVITEEPGTTITGTTTTTTVSPNAGPTTISSQETDTTSSPESDPTQTTTKPTTAGATTSDAVTPTPVEITTLPPPTTTLASVIQITKGFDTGSFIGGMILSASIILLIGVGCKFFRKEKKPDYNTL